MKQANDLFLNALKNGNLENKQLSLSLIEEFLHKYSHEEGEVTEDYKSAQKLRKNIRKEIVIHVYNKSSYLADEEKKFDDAISLLEKIISNYKNTEFFDKIQDKISEIKKNKLLYPYSLVAGIISTPIYPPSEKINFSDLSLNREHERVNEKIAFLRKIKTNDSQLLEIVNSNISKFRTASKILENIAQKEGVKLNLIETTIGHTIDEGVGWGTALGTLATFLQHGQIKTQKENYRKLINLIRKETSQLLIIAKKYSGKNLERNKTGTIGIGYDYSWYGAYNSDTLTLRNFNPYPLNHVTVEVTLIDDKEGIYSHVHYIKKWKPSSNYSAEYWNEETDYSPSLVSYAAIKRVEVDIYSDEMRNKFEYHYTKENFTTVDGW